MSAAFDEAIRFYQAGKAGAAEHVCRKLLDSEPANATAWHLLGLAQFQQQRPADALASFERALALKPDYAEALANRGSALQILKRGEDALASYDRALALKPNDFRTLNNRGSVLRELFRPQEALASVTQALAIRPDYAGAWNNRGLALRDLKRPEEALASFERALALAPGHADAIFNRALTFSDLKRQPEALAGFDRLLAAAPDDSEVLTARGIALTDMKRFGEALASFEHVLRLEPGNAAARNNRGTALRGLKRLEEARASYEQALALKPDFAAALYNRGLVFCDLIRFAEALADFEAALAIEPAFAAAANDRATALKGLGRLEEALDAVDAALAMRADYAEAHYNRGGILQGLKRFDETLASYDAALARKPDFVEALSSRASLLWTQFGRHDLAVRDLERVVAVDPSYPYALGELLHLRMYGADWRDFETQTAALDAGVRAGKRVVTPFIYQVTSDSPADLQACAVIYAKDRYPTGSGLFAPRHSGQGQRKIRLGYVSGEFRSQATAFLMAGLYEAHDKSQFELVAFDNGRRDDSPTRRRLEAAFDRFVSIAALPDIAAAEAVAAEKIDILINLNGYFGEGRMGVFALRPAPIQVGFLGFPGTLGADYIDYILADRIVIPERDRGFYTEKVVYLPDCYQVNDFRRPIAENPLARGAHGLPDGAFVFCNFNQGYKLTPAMFAAWMRILRQTEKSVLWLLQSTGAFTQNLRRAAQAAGVAGERLIFAPHISAEDHLARLALADLFLDSIPCNAHTTASDALWAGLPLLTCRGGAFAGRVAASLLSAIGLPELAAENLEQYESLALELAEDAGFYRSIRQKLAQNRLTTPLFDTDRFRRHLEEAYRSMWNNHTD